MRPMSRAKRRRIMTQARLRINSIKKNRDHLDIEDKEQSDEKLIKEKDSCVEIDATLKKN